MNRLLAVRTIAALAATMVLMSATAATTEVADVKLENSVELRGSKLQLNGAGIRYKAIFKVYTAGLYLGTKAASLEEVLAVSGPKRMTITMLRDIEANELGRLFTRGVEDNSPPNEFSALIPGLMRMSQIFSDQKQLKKGDTFEIDWVPGSGTVITVKGRAQGEPIKEVAFFNSLLRIWLGPAPADWKLKEALLGRNG